MIIAQTILNQLGANRFSAMTGAKNFVGGDASLQFDIGRNASKANKVRITLANDLYTIEFFKFSIRSLECKSLRKIEGIFADQLREIFTKETGLHVSL